MVKRRYNTYRGSVEANSKERSLNCLPADYPSRPWSAVKVAEIRARINKAIGPIAGQADLGSLSSSIDLCWLRDDCPSIFIDSIAVL